MKFLIPVLLILLQSDSFLKFSYCKETTRGPYERQCVELNPAGKGMVRFKRRSMEEISVDVALSNSARDRFVMAVDAMNNLEGADAYESPRKVADLGTKHFTLETSSGKKEAEFNFSQKKEVNDLMNFFDGVINEEMVGFDIDNALQFDRLSIPKKLDQIDVQLKSNRFADPERLIPILDKIQADHRIMNYARDRAGKMKQEILTKKSGR
jgi:hypothetical protein